jgi:hypothetical protein
MTIKTTSDGAAAVDTEVRWIPIAERMPPSGAKLLLINRKYGVAHISIYRKADDWTHWAGLPKFKD